MEEAPGRDNNSTRHDVSKDGAIPDTAGIMISGTEKHPKDGTVGISEANKPNKDVPKGEDRLETGDIGQSEHREHKQGAAAEPVASYKVEDSNREKEEEEMENTVIRRVGFVFLAYNVEFWWVVVLNHARLGLFIMIME
jgi:hypothetical protein